MSDWCFHHECVVLQFPRLPHLLDALDRAAATSLPPAPAAFSYVYLALHLWRLLAHAPPPPALADRLSATRPRRRRNCEDGEAAQCPLPCVLSTLPMTPVRPPAHCSRCRAQRRPRLPRPHRRPTRTQPFGAPTTLLLTTGRCCVRCASSPKPSSPHKQRPALLPCRPHPP